ncbi:hypothetical protein CLU96_4228 [Chryseobacterium sp. 52]|uniref:hypothetical protein n=1 Tax=Chryseobacterium sp. 52 TaxID=2035213 RepID=UPI000C1926BE|nr:hypothetical protein [Chryseobacterium sp. 52]PIF47179.1 hypothetical protein CLU96_4228 [Chryseobacterium sp. 52]
MVFLRNFLHSKKHLSTKVGALCSAISLVMTLTGFIPVLTIVPVAFLAELLVSMFGDQREGMKAFILLAVIFLTAVLVMFTAVKNLTQKGLTITKKEILMIMFIFYWIVHPLGFYIYWAAFTNFSNDGQIILGAIFSFPFSSLSFVAIGFLMDIIIKKYSLQDQSIQ